jgi:methylisocitrate lyase
MTSVAERRAAFKARLLDTTQPPMAFPGAFNAAVARLIQQLGFEGVYVSGAGLHNGVAGIPDEGGLSCDEMAQFSGYIARAVQVPVIADADTGFGDIARCVEAYEYNGLCGLHLEDQVFPKRCGHLDGKQVIAVEEMQDRIRQAVSARKDSNFLIIARVDSRSVVGYHDAVERAKAYMAAGADMIFAEAMQTQDEFAQFVTKTQAPLLANMTEFGKSPYLSFEEFAAMGYRLVIYP